MCWCNALNAQDHTLGFSRRPTAGCLSHKATDPKHGDWHQFQQPHAECRCHADSWSLIVAGGVVSGPFDVFASYQCFQPDSPAPPLPSAVQERRRNTHLLWVCLHQESHLLKFQMKFVLNDVLCVSDVEDVRQLKIKTPLFLFIITQGMNVRDLAYMVHAA